MVTARREEGADSAQTGPAQQARAPAQPEARATGRGGGRGDAQFTILKAFGELFWYEPTAEDTHHQHAARMRRVRLARASGRGSRPQRERPAAAEKSPLAAGWAAGGAWTPRQDFALASACLKRWCLRKRSEFFFRGLELFFFELAFDVRKQSKADMAYRSLAHRHPAPPPPQRAPHPGRERGE